MIIRASYLISRANRWAQTATVQQVDTAAPLVTVAGVVQPRSLLAPYWS